MIVALIALLVPILSWQSGTDPVKERLANSPRHHEWVEVRHGERTVRCFVAFPEVKEKAPAVLVLHENKGLNDWARSVADQLAEAGYIALAPDLLSGMGEKGGGTESFANTDAATQAIYKLEPAQITADLDAVFAHAKSLEACDGKRFVLGFCWGGSQSFAYATKQKDLAAAFVFYGSAPTEEAELAKIICPVYGFYGESDARITSGVAATVDAMKKAAKTFEPVTYAGAGHGFFRSGEALDASEPNKKARADAWTRLKGLLAK